MSVSIDRHSIIIDRTDPWIVLLMLCPLNSLSSAKDIGQVFVDVACGAKAFPFLFAVHLHLPHFSSPLALRRRRNPSS